MYHNVTEARVSACVREKDTGAVTETTWKQLRGLFRLSKTKRKHEAVNQIGGKKKKEKRREKEKGKPNLNIPKGECPLIKGK